MRNSNLQTIERYAFSHSNIEKIYLPKSLKELKEGWCNYTINLKKITISPSNDQFVFKENKYLVGKSDKNSDEFDILLFVNCDIKQLSIPTNIKFISSYAFSRIKIEEISIPPNVSNICENAFYDCQNLLIVEVLEESKLKSLSPLVFSSCKKVIIMIPSSLKTDFK